MKISGFSFVRNAIRLYYPVVEAIQSILSICDEFIIACGDSDDGTTDLIRSIGSDKITIIETVWDPKYFVHGAVNAQQTNVALSQCTGDWCFYVQADEVVHEKYLPIIREKMERYLHTPQVEGLLFDYKHFYGDYDHYQTAHNWYRREVRVVRNHIGVQSWESAQGFRKNGKKLRVVLADAEICHYGWVRPPKQMKAKQIALDSVHHDKDWVDQRHPDKNVEYDYGTLKTLAAFTDTHPEVMESRIREMDWVVIEKPGSREHKHNRLSIRLLSFIENNILGTRIGEYRNYVLIKPFSLQKAREV